MPLNLLQRDVNLKSLNTFGMEVKAQLYAEFSSINELRELLNLPEVQANRILILGGGSNVLFTQDFEGVVLRNRIMGIQALKEDGQHIWVKSGAGVTWHDLVEFAIQNGLGGIENLSLIPGTVGAAPMQNIGAYGVELKETFDSLEAVETGTGKLHIFDHTQCDFGYRQSIFKQELKDKFVITSVILRLTKKPSFNTSYGAISSALEAMQVKEPTLRAVSDAVVSIRRSKLPDPAVIGNAGSFFKNPEISAEQFEQLKNTFPEIPSYPAPHGLVKVPAGWLIEQCGWKGRRIGNYGVHEHQALVLVNHGGAEGAQVRQLAHDIIASVKEKFGIELHPEVNIY
jgi:UDP-N-acetylmuramate dehydrogenase